MQAATAFILSCFVVAIGYGFIGYQVLKIVLYVLFGIKINIDIKLRFDRK